jgi:hypothetical protein
MSEVGVTQTLVIGHLWQSVALAAVLALVLILGKRMRGATRYGLGVAAFMASLALPLAAFIPGETIVAGLLKQLDAPIALQPVEIDPDGSRRHRLDGRACGARRRRHAGALHG